MSYQISVIMKNTEWVTPSEFPDLSEESEIAIDLETRDENMKKLGTGWARHDGEIVGIAVAAGSFKDTILLIIKVVVIYLEVKSLHVFNQF